MNAFLAKQVFGPQAVTVRARVVLWDYPARDEYPPRTTILGIGIDSSVTLPESKGQEMWDCDVVLIPRAKFRNPSYPLGNASNVISNGLHSFNPEEWEEISLPEE